MIEDFKMTKKEYNTEIFKKLEKSQGHDYASLHFVSILVRISLDTTQKYGPDFQEWELLEEEDILKYVNNNELWDMIYFAC